MPLKSWLKSKKGSADKRPKAGGDADADEQPAPAQPAAVGASPLPQSPAVEDGDAKMSAADSGPSSNGVSAAAPVSPPKHVEPWRVEHIRPVGPPRDGDWWEDDDDEQDDNHNNSNSKMDISLEKGGENDNNNNDDSRDDGDGRITNDDRADEMSLDSQSGPATATATAAAAHAHPHAPSSAAAATAAVAAAAEAQALSSAVPSSAVAVAACCGVNLEDIASNLSAASASAAAAARSPPATKAITASSSQGPEALPVVPMEEAGRRGSPAEDSRSSRYSSDGSYYSDDRGTFRNVGLETWQLSREAWRTYPPPTASSTSGSNNANEKSGEEGDGEEEEFPVSPANINTNGRGGKDTSTSLDRSSDSTHGGGGHASAALQGLSVQQQEAVLRGLTRVTRTYQLPRKVSLPDMVSLLNDIWDCEKDY